MQNDPFSNHTSTGLAGGKSIQFDDIIHTGQLIPQRLDKAMMQAFGAIFAFKLVVMVIEFGITLALSTFLPAALLFAVPAIRFFVFLVDVALVGFAVSLYAPLKRNLLSGSTQDRSISDLLVEVKEHYLFCTGTVLLTVAAIPIGTFFCVIPGVLAAWALLMAPYYSSQGSAPFTAAEDSLEAAKAHIPIIGITMVAIVFAGLLTFGFGVGFASVMNRLLGASGAFISLFGYWIIQSVVMLGIWVVMGAVGITIDTSQTGERIAG